MIKRTSKNFKVPLVYGGQWKDHQTFQKWDPVSKRLTTVNCCLPAKCTFPEPVTNVTLTSMVSGSAVVSWSYDGPIAQFEVNIYQGDTENVNTNGTPIYSALGLTSGSTVYFTNVSTYYYVASVRVRNNCLFSSYAYSSPVQYSFSGYEFRINSFSDSANPPSGTIDIFLQSGSIYGLNISIYDNSSNNVTTFLNNLLSSTTIKIQKDLSNYEIYNSNGGLDFPTYFFYECQQISKVGTFNINDIVTITYT